MFASRLWPEWFREQLQGGIPRNYLSFDIESTGFDRNKDLVTEIGHILVEDGKVIDRGSFLLDWTTHPFIKHGWLRERLVSVGLQLANYSGRNEPYHIDFSSMQEKGVEPATVFKFYSDLIRDVSESGFFVVGHNILGFDEAMLEHNIVGFGYDKEFGLGDLVFDTQSMDRFVHLCHDAKYRVKRGETPRGYFYRLLHSKGSKGVKLPSSKLKECFQRYDLAGICEEQNMSLHSAEFDAYVCHLLLSQWSKMDQGEVSFVSAFHEEQHINPFDLPVDEGHERREKEDKKPPVDDVERMTQRFRGQRNR